MEALTKIRELLEERGAEGLLLTRRDNYSWATAGGRNHVMRTAENGVGTLAITREQVRLIADRSDCDRLRDEENPLGAEPLPVPWHVDRDSCLRVFIAGRKFLSDDGVAGTQNIQPALVSLRMQLTEEALAVYRRAGALCADVVESVCRDAEPGQTESEIARRVCEGAMAGGIYPDCVLVGGDDRIDRYRHPLPTDRPVQDSLMVVLGGEMRGLYISMTRMVRFSPAPSAMAGRYDKVQQIFANMQLRMRDGLPYQDFFATLQQWYREAGYPDEWKLHHQGGPTGYACREFVVNANTQGVIRGNQAYAWNPTITGAKCEETTYLDGEKVETLTRTSRWPVRSVETPRGPFGVADILIKSR